MMTTLVVFVLLVQVAMGFWFNWSQRDTVLPILLAIVIVVISLFFFDESFRQVLTTFVPNVDKVPPATLVAQLIAYLIGEFISFALGRNKYD